MMTTKTGAAFGLVYEFLQYRKDLYMERFNNNIRKINAVSACELPIPARFVIGQERKILDATVDPDYRFRSEPAVTLAFINNLA